MIKNPQVPLHRLILSLSEALDYRHPTMADHQQRVAYIAVRLARQMEFGEDDQLEVFSAAALHDIGLIRLDNTRLHASAFATSPWHAEVGYELLRGSSMFRKAASIIRYHHVRWDDGKGKEARGQEVPFFSHLISLADFVENSLQRDLSPLAQCDHITSKVKAGANRFFHPDCVDAFMTLARKPAFWLDCVCPRIYSLLLNQIDWPVLTADAEVIARLAEVFGLIVDSQSRWTATHSAGVAATAAALAGKLGLSPRELVSMRTAGYLHDLGKLSVPNSVLDKPEALDDQEWAMIRGHTYHTFRLIDTIGDLRQINEWASFHHERLDGNGYPFHHTGHDLTLGSRIMAVADTFTAMTEDRPYRSGMTVSRALELLGKEVANGGMDGDVLNVLARESEIIDGMRRHEQAVYLERQRQLSEFIETLQTQSADAPSA